MAKYEAFKRRMGAVTSGQAKKQNSDKIMLSTWNRDLQSRKCYLYDYYHDNHKTQVTNLSPTEDPDKVEIDAKYIVSQYKTLSKDSVEYHLMFKPDTDCPINYDWFHKDIYPLGLYVDIPDDTGKFNKWLICDRDYSPQFPKFTILPCNYVFYWKCNDTIYTMSGVSRMRNSYNSGTWTDYLSTVVDNQDAIWFPMNEASATLYYDIRLIVSDVIDIPITWKVSKIENTHPIGINKITLAQTKFNPIVDYVNKETRVMIADYYSSPIQKENKEVDTSVSHSVITFSGSKNIIKAKASKRTFYAVFYDKDNNVIDDKAIWTCRIDGNIVTTSDSITITDNGNNTLAIKINDDSYLNKVLQVSVTDSSGGSPSQYEVEVVNL